MSLAKTIGRLSLLLSALREEPFSAGTPAPSSATGSLKLKKSWLANLDLLAVSKNAWIHLNQDRIYIEHKWIFGVVDQKTVKISGLEEVEVEQAGLLKQFLNFGTITFKGQGVTESIMFVKNPNFYKQYLTPPPK